MSEDAPRSPAGGRRRSVRASEIGAYIFCQRAWWYQSTGQESENAPELAAGTDLHDRHGQAALETGCLRTLAYILLLAALGLAAAYLANQWIK